MALKFLLAELTCNLYGRVHFIHLESYWHKCYSFRGQIHPTHMHILTIGERVELHSLASLFISKKSSLGIQSK